MTSVLVEGTTVVGDSFKAGDSSDTTQSLKPPGAGKGRDYASEFTATKDYTLEERPFFVRIGKNGVIAALEKLDQQLDQASLQSFVSLNAYLYGELQAGRSRVLSKKSPTDWAGKEVIPGRMGLINHGYVLSAKCFRKGI
jgi:hypothetical protein